jgi:hypothetical protein
MNRRPHLHCILLLLLALSLAAGCRSDTITSKVVAAYGGKEAITRASRVFAAGRITGLMRGGNGRYARLMERDRKLRVEIEYPGITEIRILNGSRGWRSENAPLSEVTGFQYQAMLYQYKQLDLPYGLMTGQYTVKDAGKAQVDGIDTEVLELSDKDGPPMKVYVDLKDYRIVMVEGAFEVNGRKTSLAAKFSDFRVVDGLLVPFSITNYGGGQMIGETVIGICRINPPENERVFMP